MRRNSNPTTAHFVAKYTIPIAAAVVVAALYNGVTDISAVVFVFVVSFVLIVFLGVLFVVLDALGRHLRGRIRGQGWPAETTRPTATATKSEMIPLQYAGHSPPRA